MEVKRPRIEISAVVTRADGTIEDLGVICEDAEIIKKDEVKQHG